MCSVYKRYTNVQVESGTQGICNSWVLSFFNFSYFPHRIYQSNFLSDRIVGKAISRRINLWRKQFFVGTDCVKSNFLSDWIKRKAIFCQIDSRKKQFFVGLTSEKNNFSSDRKMKFRQNKRASKNHRKVLGIERFSLQINFVTLCWTYQLDN